MPILTSSQLTFTDLKDAYHVQIDPEYIALDCDKNGAVNEDQTISIHFGAYMGENRVGTIHAYASDVPNGITIDSANISDATTTYDGVINVTIPSGSIINNMATSTIKLILPILDSNTVYGRNLILGTEKWLDSAFYISDEYGPFNGSIADGVLTVPKGNASIDTCYVAVVPNEIYTVSVDIKSTNSYNNTTLIIQYYDETGTRRSYNLFKTNVTTAWSRISTTFTIPDGITKIRIGIRSSGGYENSYRLLKLEKGYQATAWTPAPEDNGVIDFMFTKYITLVKSVVGATGESAVLFRIYSQDGTSFAEDMTELTLQTAAVDGLSDISTASYAWYWYDNIEGIWNQIGTDSSITVLKTDEFAFATIKCELTYNSNIYTDYITLTNQVVIYTSEFKFFNGSNMFSTNDDLLIAYVSLYRNNQEIDMLKTTLWCRQTDTENFSVDLSANEITFNQISDVEIGQYMYFVYHSEDGYAISLGECISIGNSVSVWTIIDDTYEYIYSNSIQDNKILLISKNDVSRTMNVTCSVYKKLLDENGDQLYNEESFLSSTSVNIIDVNDPIVSDIPPKNANVGQLWVDISTNPYTIKCFNGEEWVDSNPREGGTVYISRPSDPIAGDIWILNDDESYEHDGITYGPGTMLKAVLSDDGDIYWADTQSETNSLLKSVREALEFLPEKGLIISQKVTDENGNNSAPFYVQISSEEMGFYDNSENTNDKVVAIGNKSATIQNANFNGNTMFNNDASFEGDISIQRTTASDNVTSVTGFKFQIESNGSFSLVAITD